jgi:hypothetical protein
MMITFHVILQHEHQCPELLREKLNSVRHLYSLDLHAKRSLLAHCQSIFIVLGLHIFFDTGAGMHMHLNIAILLWNYC